MLVSSVQVLDRRTSRRSVFNGFLQHILYMGLMVGAVFMQQGGTVQLNVSNRQIVVFTAPFTPPFERPPRIQWLGDNP